MVEIAHHPIKELEILECYQYHTVESLCGTIATVVADKTPFVINWVDGVAFSYMPQPPRTEWLIKERLKGRIYWLSVVYALMPNYRERLRVGKIDIRLVKTQNPLLQQVGKWLKDRKGPTYSA